MIYLPEQKDENKLLTSDGSYLRKVEKRKGTSFSVVSYTNPYFAAPLHIHPEYELILIEEGKGLSFVGDSIQELSPGDFMLIGKNLPHLWLSADEYYQNSGLVSRSVYTQFDDRIFPASLHDIPELENIYSLLKKSQKGVFFTGGSIEALKELFRSLVAKEGFEKIEGLYTLLYRLSSECNHATLTTENYINSDSTEDPIINKVHLFINKNYQNNIALEDIACNVGMNPSALCRYYKNIPGKECLNTSRN